MKALILILMVLSTGCTTAIKSPLTQIEYIGYIKEEGIGISLKPPLWEAGVSLYKSFTKDDNEDTQDD